MDDNKKILDDGIGSISKNKASLIKDGLSGFFTYDALSYYVCEYLKHMDSKNTCALLIVSIDNINLIKYKEGKKVKEEILQVFARELSKMFRASDVIGQNETNEFIIFMSDPFLTKEVVYNKAKSICQIKFPESVISTDISTYIGIYITNRTDLNFKTYYNNARASLINAYDKKTPVYIIYDDSKNQILDQDRLIPVQTSPVPIEFLLNNMAEDIRILEMSEPIKPIYVSPNFYNDQDNNLMIHPHDYDKYHQMLRKAISQEVRLDGEYRVSFDGDNWHWRYIRVIKIPYKGIRHPVILEISQDINDSREKDQYLIESGKMLKIAFENTTKAMWEVDVENKKYIFFNFKDDFDHQFNTLDNFPESLISTGWVHPDSASQFLKFGADILNGKTEGSGSFIMRYRLSDNYGWASLSYHMIFDSDGFPIKAIGVKNFLSDDSNRKQEMISSPALPDAVYPSLVLSVKANLTEDSIKELWVEGVEKTDFVEIKKYSDVVTAERERLFARDDRKSFENNLSRTALLQEANHEIIWKSMEYRRVYLSGSIHWVLNTVNLIKDPITENVYLFNYLNDIEHRHRLEYGINVIKDPITGFYGKDTIKQMIKNLINEDTHSAIALVNINGFAAMEDDEYGTQEQKQSYIAAILLLALGTKSIIGQYNEDTLIVYFTDIKSPSIVKKRLEDAFSFVRSSLSGTKIMRLLRFVACIRCIEGYFSNYDQLINRLKQGCYLWKNSASDIAVFLDEQDDETNLWQDGFTNNEDLSVALLDSFTTLSSEEKDIVLKCLAYMAMSNSLDNSIKNTLQNIGQYYKADRVYILSLSENDHVITMANEWTKTGKHSIQRAILGMRVDKFPFLCRCMNEQKPVVIKNRKYFGSIVSDGMNPNWSFIAIPVIYPKGFFCIENPQIHHDSTALVTAMIKYISNVSKSRQRNDKYLINTTDDLTNLSNLRCYSDVVDSINSDLYNSLGALALDIPNLTIINSTQGFEYGSKIILHVSEILSETFGKTYLFRTWDCEFVALCPNTTLEVFIDKCTRVRDILQQSYYKQIRIGYTWSGGVFYAKKLVKEAKTIMHCESIQAIPPLDYVSVWGMHNFDFGSAVAKGKFVVYFQPQINMKTGTVVGAEALIRGIDDNNELIPPGKFIDTMEKNGTIRDLDFFVLDRTFSFMEKWYLKGYDLIKMSVNISRATLLDPTTPASILAIQSRYPEILSKMIEFEITESACNIEKATLDHIMDNFRQFGIKFSLDDFGSHYSNIAIFTNVKFDTVKLDRSLINELASNEANRLLVKNIIQICQKGNIVCVAEGVETKAQVATLLEIGCAICQGYYYSKPLPVKEFEQKWLNNGGN